MMKVFAVGDVLAAADVNQYCVNTRFISKTTPTSRNNAPGFANDPDLQLTVDAACSYLLKLQVQLTSPAAAGFQFAFSGPANSHLNGRWLNWNPGGVIGTAAYDGNTNDLNDNQVLGGTTGTPPNWLLVEAILSIPASGTFQFRWAQQNSNAASTAVLAGSSMSLWRVA